MVVFAHLKKTPTPKSQTGRPASKQSKGKVESYNSNKSTKHPRNSKRAAEKYSALGMEDSEAYVASLLNKKELRPGKKKSRMDVSRQRNEVRIPPFAKASLRHVSLEEYRRLVRDSPEGTLTDVERQHVASVVPLWHRLIPRRYELKDKNPDSFVLIILWRRVFGKIHPHVSAWVPKAEASQLEKTSMTFATGLRPHRTFRENRVPLERPDPSDISEAKAKKRRGKAKSADLKVLEDDRLWRLADPERKKKRTDKHKLRVVRAAQPQARIESGIDISASLASSLDGANGARAKRDAKRALAFLIRKNRQEKLLEEELNVQAHGGDKSLEQLGLMNALQAALGQVMGALGNEWFSKAVIVTHFALDVITAIQSIIDYKDGRVDGRVMACNLARLTLNVVRTSNDLYRDVVEAQGNDSPIVKEGIIGSVISWFHNLFCGTNEEIDVDEKRARRIASISNMFKSLQDIVTRIGDFFFACFKTVYEWVTGVPYMDNSCSKHAAELAELTSKMDGQLAKKDATVSRLAFAASYRVEIKEMYTKYLSLISYLTAHVDKNHYVAQVVATARTVKEAWENLILAPVKVADAALFKRRAVATMFFGPPGVGKSHIASAYLYPLRITNVFQKAKTSDYYEGYIPSMHKAILVDDFFQNTNPEDRTKLAVSTIELLSDAPTPLDSASLHTKGTTFFCSEHFVGTTNERVWTNINITSVEALARRFNFIMVKPKPEAVQNPEDYVDENLDLKTKRVIWKKGLEANLKEINSLDEIYNFTLMRFDPDTNSYVVDRKLIWKEIREIRDNPPGLQQEFDFSKFNPGVEDVRAQGKEEQMILDAAFQAKSSAPSLLLSQLASSMKGRKPEKKNGLAAYIHQLFSSDDRQAIVADQYFEEPTDSDSDLEYYFDGCNLFVDLLERSKLLAGDDEIKLENVLHQWKQDKEDPVMRTAAEYLGEYIKSKDKLEVPHSVFGNDESSLFGKMGTEIKKRMDNLSKTVGNTKNQALDKITGKLENSIFAAAKNYFAVKVMLLVEHKLTKWFLPSVIALIVGTISAVMMNVDPPDYEAKLRETHPEWFIRGQGYSDNKSGKKAIKRTGLIIAQGTDQVYATAAQAMLSRTFAIKNLNSGASLWAFAIDSKTLVTSHHVFAETSTECIVLTSHKGEVLALNDENCVFNESLKDFDHLVISLLGETTLPGIKGAVSLASREELNNKDNFKNIFSLAKTQGITSVVDIPSSSWSITSSVKSFTWGSQYQWTQPAGDIIYKNVTRVAGDCGLPLWTLNSKNECILIGLHHGASVKDNYATPLVLEDWEAARAQGKIRVRIPAITNKVLEEEDIKLEYLGDVRDIFNDERLAATIPVVSEFVPSPLAEVLHEGGQNDVRLRPAALIPVDGVDPLILALKKYQRSDLPMPATIIPIAREWIYENLGEKTDVRLAATFSFKKWLNSRTLNDEETRNTSAGFPWKFMYNSSGRAMMHRRDCYDRNGHLENSVKEACLNLAKAWKNDQEGDVYYSLCLKDELRPVEKVENLSTRIFQTSPMHLLLTVRAYTNWFTKLLHDNRRYNSATVMIGINVHSVEWKLLYKKHSEFGRHVDGDFSGYDFSQRDWWVDVVLIVFETAYTFQHQAPLPNKLRNFYKRMLQDIMHAKMVVGRSVVRAYQGNATGQPLTADFNSIITAIALEWAIKQVHPSLTRKDYALSVYGDDSLISANVELDTIKIAKFLKNIGFVWTSASSKDKAPEMGPLNKVRFLKRAFRPDADNFRIFAPRKHTEAVARLRWMRDEKTWKDSLTSFIQDSVHFSPSRRKAVVNLLGKYFTGLSENLIDKIAAAEESWIQVMDRSETEPLKPLNTVTSLSYVAGHLTKQCIPVFDRALLAVATKYKTFTICRCVPAGTYKTESYTVHGRGVPKVRGYHLLITPSENWLHVTEEEGNSCVTLNNRFRIESVSLDGSLPPEWSPGLRQAIKRKATSFDEQLDSLPFAEFTFRPDVNTKLQ